MNFCKESLQNHNQILLDKIKDKEQRVWYAEESVENSWSVSILSQQIASKLYERQALLGNKTTNFDETLPSPNNEQAKELLKDPYIFDFISADKDLKELDIERELTTNITKLLLELGSGFAFVGRQYHLEIENEDYYIDLLFYNLSALNKCIIDKWKIYHQRK